MSRRLGSALALTALLSTAGCNVPAEWLAWHGGKTVPPNQSLAAGACWQAKDSQRDVRFDGPADHFNNATLFTAGSHCATAIQPAASATVVAAADATSAVRECRSLAAQQHALPVDAFTAVNLAERGYNAPADVWGCSVITPGA
jgi:hypothetical protein